MSDKKAPSPRPPRKQHWINMCNSSGCEIQLFDQKYTIWLSNKDWKQAERDGERLIAGLELLEEHTHLLAEAVREAKAQGLDREAELYEDFADFIYEDREECRGDEDCDHCVYLAWAHEKRQKASELRKGATPENGGKKE